MGTRSSLPQITVGEGGTELKENVTAYLRGRFAVIAMEDAMARGASLDAAQRESRRSAQQNELAGLLSSIVTGKRFDKPVSERDLGKMRRRVGELIRMNPTENAPFVDSAMRLLEQKETEKRAAEQKRE